MNTQLLIIHLAVGLGASASLSGSQWAYWGFGDVSGAVHGSTFAPSREIVYGQPTLEMFNQEIDANGRDGVRSTDSVGVTWEPSKAIRWDDTQDDSPPGPVAELWISFDVEVGLTGFFTSLTFDYASEDDDFIRVDYSINNGNNWTLVNTPGVVDGGGWQTLTVDLTGISLAGIAPGGPPIIFRISHTDTGGGSDWFAYDNVEVEGYHLSVGGPYATVDYGLSTTTSDDYISVALNDPYDPLLYANPGLGLVMHVYDYGGVDPYTYGISVTSGNQTVLAQGDILGSSTGGQGGPYGNITHSLFFEPSAVGYSDITYVAYDTGGSLTPPEDDYHTTIHYAVSQGGGLLNTFHHEMSDASTALAIDGDHMLVANDELQGQHFEDVIFLYERNVSGYPPVVAFNRSALVNLADPFADRELDLEGSSRVGNRLFWVGSCGNSTSGASRPNRSILFSTTLSGSGAASSLSSDFQYDTLRSALLNWDAANGHGLGANVLFAGGFGAPETESGLNLEGFAISANGSTAYLGFRSPRIKPASGLVSVDSALVIPITNFLTWFDNGAQTNPPSAPTFGAPIFWDLGGLTVRSIERNASGEYLVIGGMFGSGGPQQLFSWNGMPASQPSTLESSPLAGVAGGRFEAIVETPNPIVGGRVQLLTDNGDTQWYLDGRLSKHVMPLSYQKFASELVDLPRAVWQASNNGTAATGVGYNYAMGYHFTPQVDGQVVALGGLYSGTKRVKLFNKATGALLAEADVASANAFSYVSIPPVDAPSSTTLTVAVYLAGSGGSYSNYQYNMFPLSSGDVVIEGSTYAPTSSNPNAIPTNTYRHRMYGQADVKFVEN